VSFDDKIQNDRVSYLLKVFHCMEKGKTFIVSYGRMKKLQLGLISRYSFCFHVCVLNRDYDVNKSRL